jgi:hypothetical protein
MTTHVEVLLLVLILGFTAQTAHAVPASEAAIERSVLEAPAADETFNLDAMRVQRYGDHGRTPVLVPGLESGSWAWKGQIERFRTRP